MMMASICVISILQLFSLLIWTREYTLKIMLERKNRLRFKGGLEILVVFELQLQVLLLGSMVWPYLANRDVHGPVQQ